MTWLNVKPKLWRRATPGEAASYLLILFLYIISYIYIYIQLWSTRASAFNNISAEGQCPTLSTMSHSLHHWMWKPPWLSWRWISWLTRTQQLFLDSAARHILVFWSLKCKHQPSISETMWVPTQRSLTLPELSTITNTDADSLSSSGCED